MQNVCVRKGTGTMELLTYSSVWRTDMAVARANY